jgi:hypothetical protein
MIVIRVFPDEQVQAAIVDAAAKFESRISEVVADYAATLASDARSPQPNEQSKRKW